MKDLTLNARAERMIITTYRKTLWRQFIQAVKKYRMISAGDKIAVCISGGKDSMLLAKLIQEFKKYSGTPFEAVYLTMNPGYNKENSDAVYLNAELLNIPITVFHTDIFQAAASAEQNACYLCARMRRGHLYAKAKELGCNKIALGHHKNDVAETTLMGMFYGAQIQGMLPRLKSTNFEGMELIRPMYFISENDIIKWRDANALKFVACACRFTENAQAMAKTGEIRSKIKDIIKTLRIDNPQIEDNILKSLENVQLDTLIEYKTKGKRRNFLENFDI